MRACSDLVRLGLAAMAFLGCNDPPRPAIVQDSSATTGSAPVGSTATTTAAPPTAQPHKAADGALKVVQAAQDSDALSLIRTKRLEAKAEGRVLVVYVGATWCDPCKKMKAEMEAGRLDARLGKTTFLAFDADKDQDRLASVGYTFKFIPYVALPGADGRPTETAEARGKGADAYKEILGTIEGWQSSVK